jgi:hypothetical protein
MPGEPKPSTVATETSRGMVTTHIVSSIGDNKSEYLIAWTEYTEPEKVRKSPVTLLERAGRALIESKSGTLISESEMSLNGYPARAFVFEEGDGRQVSVRFYLVKNRLYQVQVEIAKDSGDPEAIDRFFSSFKLVSELRAVSAFLRASAIMWRFGPSASQI